MDEKKSATILAQQQGTPVDNYALWQQLGYSGENNQFDFKNWLAQQDADIQSAITYDAYALKYFIDAQKYRGNDYYYQQLMNNLSQYNQASYSPNLKQQVMEALGDTSSRDQFNLDRRSNLLNEQQRILEGIHTEDVTNPINQAQKQREAGLNPDLTGGISSQEAGSIDQPQQPFLPTNNGQSALDDIVSVSLNVITSAIGMAQTFQSMQANDLSLAEKEMSLYDSSNSFMLGSLGNLLSEEQLRILLDPKAMDGSGKNAKRKWSDEQVQRATDTLNTSLSTIFEDPRFSRRLRKQFKKSLDFNSPLAGSISVDSKLYQLLSDVYNNKRDAVQSAGHPFTSGGFEKCLEIFGKHIQDTVINIQKLQAKFDKDRLSVSGEDKKSLGTLAGESDAAAYTSESYAKEYQKEVDKMWKEIMDDIKLGPDKDKWWSKALLFLIPIARTMLSNMNMPSISHSTSQSVNAKGEVSSNSSWSF